MPTVVPFEEMRVSPTACLFEGRDEAPVSSFITAHEHGQGAELHFHPYPEVFVVLAGTARFTVGEEEAEVESGHVVVVPEDTPHGFKCAGDETLRIVSIHPSPTVIQTWL